MREKHEIKERLLSGFQTAFIDSSVKTNLAYLPGFVSNNPNQGSKVISTIEYELLHCDAFAISVAFVTMGGITPLLSTLKELERKHVPGRILTTDYLTFTQPEALTKLASLENIDLSSLDTGRVVDMSWLFCGCEKLKKADLSYLDTSNVVDMSCMFLSSSGHQMVMENNIREY